jgi:signal transduction histidine kinase
MAKIQNSLTANIEGVWLIISKILWGLFFFFVVGINSSCILSYLTLLESGGFNSILSSNLIKAGLENLGISSNFYSMFFLFRILSLVLIYVIVGIVMYLRKPNQWVVLLYSLILLSISTLFSLDLISTLEQNYGVLAFLANLSFGALFFGFYIFPDGRFVPGWTKWLMVAWIIIAVLVSFVPDTPLDPNSWPIIVNLPLFIILLGSAPYALTYRYRKASNAAQRQQIKWVIFGLAINVIGFLLFWSPVNFVPELSQVERTIALYDIFGGTLLIVSYALLPLSLGYALLRSRLWDIDPIIYRTLVYILLTVVIVVLYTGLVVFFGSMLEPIGNFTISLIATGLIAVLFQPLYQFLQKSINRWLYGDRENPYRVISRLGQNLEDSISPDAILSTIVNSVRKAFKVPYAAIILKREDHTLDAVSSGNNTGELLKWSIVYHQKLVGELHISPRSPGEEFSTADLNLIKDLTRQTGIAIHAISVNLELQRARERLVFAREEERLRLRRDLHDELGSQLASQNLLLDTVYRQIETNPQAAKELLTKLKMHTQHAIQGIRHLVHDLRPPSLDDLGLVGAVREGIENYQDKLHFSFIVPNRLPSLTAAVEVAAFRIIQEAVANVVKHAKATKCQIIMEVKDGDRHLFLKVKDNGQGVHLNSQSGIGLNTMRERAEELGGTFQIIGNEPVGTQIIVQLPLQETS